MFREKYEKFKKSITDFNIIPEESRKIVLCLSGGKDGGVLTHLLLEYRKEVRPDLEFEILTAPIPYWEQNPEDLLDSENITLDERQKRILREQRKLVDDFFTYWSKLIERVITVPVQRELYEDRIFNMNWPCIICFNTKTKALHKYLLEQPYEDNTSVAFGWTKWDAYYTLLSHLMKSTGLKWYEEKKYNNRKYKADCIYLASFLAYPRVEMGIPGKKIYRINPLIDFTDDETRALSNEINFPIIKDICKELFGDKFDQDRRYVAKYIELYSKNQKLLKASGEAFIFNYRNLLKFMQSIEIIPPLEEIKGVMYEAYNSNFDSVFGLLKY
jgi:tRNA(Ile)-lysidine synthase TilS/MesJ